MTLTTNQNKVLRALLSCKTQSEVAKQAGLSERTISNYLKQPEFLKELHLVESEFNKMVITRLARVQQKALDTINQLMTSSRSDTVRLRASIAWLDFLLRMKNSDIEQRVDELEQTIIVRIAE